MIHEPDYDAGSIPWCSMRVFYFAKYTKQRKEVFKNTFPQ
jgi:hypothetical protein